LKGAAAAFAIGAGAAIGVTLYGQLPSHWKPWTPLRVDEPVGPYTEMKLARLKTDYFSCQTFLRASGIAHEDVGEKAAPGECGWRRAVRIDQSRYPYSAPQPLIARCPLAAALAIWEAQALSPAAETHFGEAIAAIEHYGVYNCRRVNNAADGPYSEHAFANAIDIAGFRLESGRHVSVLRDWGDDTPEGAFLRDVHAGGCDVFRGVLGPDADAAHRDHFHFDMGRWNYCR